MAYSYRAKPALTSQLLWQDQGASRDVLLLDIALDNYFRLCIERMDKPKMAGDDFVNLISLVLRNAVVAYDSRDLQQVHKCRLYSF